MFLPNPGVLAAGAGGAMKTYAEFQAHIAVLANLGFRPWNNATAFSTGGYRTTAAAETGTLLGTSWNDRMGVGVTTCRVIQHGLPSQLVFNEQVASGRDIFFRVEVLDSVRVFNGINRNGYLSQSYSGPTYYPSTRCTEIIRWDGLRAWKSNPSIGSAETPYDWP